MTRRQRTHRYPRTARLNEVVLEVLAEELGRLSDPRLGFVTLTGVEVSPDLHHAAVYYSVLGHGKNAKTQPAETAEALESAGPHLRAVLGRQVRMKYLPELHFRKDPAIVAGQRVEEIIRSLRDGESSGE